MTSDQSSKGSFQTAGTTDFKPIYKTEQGRQEAAAIEQKASGIIERFDQNREVWVAREADKIVRNQQLGLGDGPAGPSGSSRQTPFQKAEQNFQERRLHVKAIVSNTRDQMLERDPGENHIRGFQAKTKISYAERLKNRAEQSQPEEKNTSHKIDKGRDYEM